MSDLAIYPMEDGFETTLAQARNGATGSVVVNDIPTSTLPSGKYTYIVANPGQSNMQVARVSGWSSSPNKHFTVDSIAVNKGPSTLYTQTNHSANSVVRISNNYQFREDIATAINSKTDSTELGNFTFTNNKASTSGNMSFQDAQTAEITLKQIAELSGADQYFAISENDTTVGHFEDKVTYGDGIKGTKVNPGGNEQIDLDIDLTDTNIFVGTSSGAGDSGKIAKLDTNGKLVSFLNTQADGGASLTEKGLVELATDAEAAAGTDETRYINSKQVKDNYSGSLTNGVTQTFTAQATETGTITIDLGKSFRVVEFALCLTGKASGGPAYGGIALKGIFECSTTPSTLNYIREWYNTQSSGGAMTLSNLTTPINSDASKITTLTYTASGFTGTITGVYREGTNLKIQYSITSINDGGYGQTYIIGGITILG